MKCSCAAERSFNSEACHFAMNSFGVTSTTLRLRSAIHMGQHAYRRALDATPSMYHPREGASERSPTRRENRAEAYGAVRDASRALTTVIAWNPSTGPKASDAVDWTPVPEGVRNEVSQASASPVRSMMVAVYVESRVDTSSLGHLGGWANGTTGLV